MIFFKKECNIEECILCSRKDDCDLCNNNLIFSLNDLKCIKIISYLEYYKCL